MTRSKILMATMFVGFALLIVAIMSRPAPAWMLPAGFGILGVVSWMSLNGWLRYVGAAAALGLVVLTVIKQ